jgi:hypothetical protein
MFSTFLLNVLYSTFSFAGGNWEEAKIKKMEFISDGNLQRNLSGARRVGSHSPISQQSAFTWGLNFQSGVAGFSLLTGVKYVFDGTTAPLTCSSREFFGAPLGMTDPCKDVH